MATRQTVADRAWVVHRPDSVRWLSGASPAVAAHPSTVADLQLLHC